MANDLESTTVGQQVTLGEAPPRILRIDGSRGDAGLALASDGSANLYVAGSVSGGKKSEFAVAKYDPSGARVWLARHSGSAGGPLGAADAIAVDASGGVYAAGTTRTTTGITSVVRGVLVKFSRDGAEQWVRAQDGPRIDKVAVDPVGDLVVAGGGPALFVQKYTSDGVLRWDSRATGVGGSLVGLAVDRAGDIVIVGVTQATATTFPSADFTIAKLDAAGHVLWQRVYSDGDTSDDRPAALAVDGDGTIAVTGTTSFDGSGEFPEHPVLVTYDADGNQRFVQVGAGFGGKAVAVDGTGDLYVSGSFPGHASRIDRTGRLIWTSAVAAGNDLAVDRRGQVFVTGGAYITTQLDHEGAVVAEHRLLSRPRVGDRVTDLELDARGAVHVTGTVFSSTISASADLVTLSFTSSAP